jgi:biopolymer transport protein ExbD
MKTFGQMEAMAAAPLASLFLLLAVLLPGSIRFARGIEVWLPLQDQSSFNCDDYHFVLVTLLLRNRANLNADAASYAEVQRALPAIYKTWRFHLLYIDADPNLPAGTVESFIAEAQLRTPDLHIAAVTPRMKGDVLTNPKRIFLPPCGFSRKAMDILGGSASERF